MVGLRNKIFECLRQNPGQELTAREIAEWITKNYKKECQEMIDRSPKIKSYEQLPRTITANIYSQTRQLLKKHPEIKVTGERPRKYCYTKSINGGTGIERDLYPPLADFLLSEHKIHSKRIDEKRSSNSSGKQGNKWLYPDVVSLEALSKDWCREINDCVKELSDKRARLWSFEVKKKINRSNVREYYFQAVSNSSWANFGYLVAKEVKVDALEELRILAGLLGIGLIKLDIKNPSQSQIMIPAKERLEIDWNTANRLAKENKDFLSYISLVWAFYKTDKVNPANWGIKR